MKIVGICILLFAFLLTSRELTERRRRRVVLFEECYRFIQHIRLQIGCYLRPVCDIAENFESAALSGAGFLDRLSAGEIPMDALSHSSLRRELGDEGYRVLSSLFATLGSGYMDDEMKLIDSCASQFLRLLETEREESPRGIRLIRTLCAGAALGIIIFVV